MTNEKDTNVIHNLFYEFHYADNLGLIKSKLTEYVATVRAEEREAALRDAILLTDTAPLCHYAGKQYIDPVALVQRMNAALEAAADENRKGEG